MRVRALDRCLLRARDSVQVWLSSFLFADFTVQRGFAQDIHLKELVIRVCVTAISAGFFRKESKHALATGSALLWPYFRLHFLGNLPSNSTGLAEDSLHMDVVIEGEESGEAIGLWDDLPTGRSSVQGTSGEDDISRGSTRRPPSVPENELATAARSQTQPRLHGDVFQRGPGEPSFVAKLLESACGNAASTTSVLRLSGTGDPSSTDKTVAICESSSLNGEPNKRFLWTTQMTDVLIDIWEENLLQLRAKKHNGPVYARITEFFNAAACCEDIVTVKQVRHKIENLSQLYRKESKHAQATGSALLWPYFRLHFLGDLPSNSSSVVEESLHMDVMIEGEEAGEAVGSCDEPTTERSFAQRSGGEDDTSCSSAEQPPSMPENHPATDARTQTTPRLHGEVRRKRPRESSFETVVKLLESELRRSRKREKKEIALAKKRICLQEEANELQREMISLMANYFGSRGRQIEKCETQHP
ncbi:uncharacterized protein LOC135370433 isoform X2 [Ornithodoros turicata]|uniref:uncharacterized protein LOC135370433 isoform X2 n=1 Tax=Ornithodoros turicata TaxID=34597 RepID=UPI003138D73D